MSTAFSEILRQARAKDGALEVQAPDDWLQGRSLFGGLQAALAVHAMRSLVPSQPLRSLQTNFIAPLRGHVRAEATLLRSGKNTTQLDARLLGEDGLCTQCMAVFGAALSSQVVVTLAPPEPRDTPPLVFPYVPGVTPNFTQHFAMRLRAGHPPFSGVETLETAFELDLRDEGCAGEAQIVALADVVPPLGLSALGAPAFGSTLSWMLELLAETADDLPLAGWRLDSTLVSARDGYTNQASTLWSPHGQPMALSRQCMLIFG